MTGEKLRISTKHEVSDYKFLKFIFLKQMSKIAHSLHFFSYSLDHQTKHCEENTRLWSANGSRSNAQGRSFSGI